MKDAIADHSSLLVRMAHSVADRSITQPVVLDFGCGSGAEVAELRSLGVSAFGCDIEFKTGNPDLNRMREDGSVRSISTRPYEIPFETNTFDWIISDQVFEHVKNYDETLAELKRVLKPDGFCLHVFPSRYRLIEPHVNVPLASIIRASWWLNTWALLGIRNEFQVTVSALEVARINKSYLSSSTNYLTKRELATAFERHFSRVSFRQDLLWKDSRTGRMSGLVFRSFPLLSRIAGTLRSRVVLTSEPIE